MALHAALEAIAVLGAIVGVNLRRGQLSGTSNPAKLTR
jgi:hypothetical protein